VEILQTLDAGNATLLVIGCVLLCAVGFVLLLVLQILGSALEIFTSIFGILGDVAGGEPLGMCGCLVLVLGCCGCAGGGIVLAQMLATCGTPQAVNFCRLFGL
jgi:hypothetical protein